MSKSEQIKAIKGMKDILPEDSALWLDVEALCARVLDLHGYRQIRTPILERTHLFSRSIGDETDIVAKEMYTFEDRDGKSLTLRPEGTASCVRAGIENGLFYNQLQRLWYVGPMFRHENPQKGRYRQFSQIGAEAYGWMSPDIEAEMLSMVQQMFIELGLEKTHLQINSLGDQAARAKYREALVDYLSEHREQLDNDSLRRLETNPLRILDSKNESVQAVLVNAPDIADYLSEQSTADFAQLQEYLQGLGIEYQLNSRLVRGLDYYNDTVFEWVNEDFGAQSTVCAGGRYDGMVAQLGGAATPGFGFAMGLDRLIQILLEQQAPITQANMHPDVFIISIGTAARQQALVMQQQLTRAGKKAVLHCGAGSMKNQFKKADKSGARLALIVGEEEAASKTVGVKPLIASDKAIEQQNIVQNDVLNAVTNLLESL
ncbi:MAG: histidine--tRNA ligase [Pseudomonadota bacterium]